MVWFSLEMTLVKTTFYRMKRLIPASWDGSRPSFLGKRRQRPWSGSWRPASAKLAVFGLVWCGGMLPVAVDALTVDVGSSSVVFTNFPNSNTDLGVLAEAGYSLRYENVVTVGGTSVDAIVTVLSVTDIDSDDNQTNGANNKLDNLDEGSSTNSSGLDTNLDVFGSSSPECNITTNPMCTGNAVLRVQFVQDGTTTAATLQNVKITVKDVDSRQFVEFASVQSYRLSSTPATRLTVSTPSGRTRFTASSASSSSSDQENWVEVTFSQLSFLDYVIGADESGSAFFGVNFSPATFTAASTVTLTPPSFTITYDGNGVGSPPSPTTGSGAQTVASAMTRASFMFSGWNTAADGTGINIAAGSSFTPSANITLYAHWTSPTVTFNNNGGSGSMSSQSASSATALTSNSFTRVGYGFGGWCTAQPAAGGTCASVSGTSYTNGGSYPFTSSATLYAVWTANPLTVTYDANGGSAPSGGASSTVTGGTLSSLATTTRDGHTFAGWFTASTGGTQVTTSAGHGQTADFTLFAQWTANSAPAVVPAAPTTSPATSVPPANTGSPSTQPAVVVESERLPNTGATPIGVVLTAMLLMFGGAVLLSWRRRATSTVR